MKSNFNKKMGATLLTAAVMAGTFVIPMANAADLEVKPEPSISYRAHVENIGWQDYTTGIAGTTGKALRMEAIEVNLNNCEDVSLNFDVHIENIGWKYGLSQSDVIGTTGKALRMEAIAIRANGLAEKGYKIQYRVHIQDIGWTDWVDEGRVAGTTGRALRIEAIEVRVNPELWTEEKELVIAKLLEYKAALSTDLAGLTEDELAQISAQIDEAIESINEAKTSEEIAQLFEEIVKVIKTVKPDIEVISQKNIEETKKAQAENLEKLAMYKTVIPTVKDLTENDLGTLNIILSNAEEDIKKANTTNTVNAAFEAFERLMNTNKYKNVALAVAQKEVADTLTPYKQNATPGVITYIEKTIENVNKETNKANISAPETYEAIVKGLIEKQEEELANLEAYVNATDNSKLSSANKAIVKLQINKAKMQVENATTTTAVTTAINKFNEYLENNYPTITDVAEEELLQNAIDAAVKKLSTYAEYGYEELTEAANEGIEEIAELTTITDVKQKQAQLVTALEAQLKSIKDAEKEAIDAYAEAYKAAMEQLNTVASTIGDLNLSKEAVADINNVINNTKQNILNVTTNTAVEKEMELFEEYMSAYYPNVEEGMTVYKVEQTRTSAIEKLNKYLDSTATGVGGKTGIAATAISSIEKVKVNESKTAEEAIDEINELANDAETTIKRIILQDAKDVAVSKFTDYVNYTSDDAEAQAEVRRLALKALNDITNSKDEKSINTAVKTGLKAIEEVLGITEESKKQAIEKARNEALAEVDVYMAMAKKLEITDLQKEINLYIDAINETDEVSVFEEKVAELAEYVAKQYPELDYKVEEIKKLEETLEAKTNNEVIKVLEKAIEDIKVAKATDKMTEKQVIDKIVTDATAEVTEIEAAYTELDEAKAAAIEVLEAEEYDNVVKAWVKEYTGKINAVKLSEYDENNNVVSDLQTKAKNTIDAYIASKKAEAKAEITNYSNKITSTVDENNNTMAGVSTQITAIEGADTAAEVTAAVNAAKLAIDKAVATAKIDEYKTDARYTALADKTAVDGLISGAKTAIAGAENSEAVKTVYDTQKGAIEAALATE